MKNLLPYSLLFALAFIIFSCDKDDEPIYATKFHYYNWNADTLPLTVPSSAFDQSFQLKDLDGYVGGIIGVPDLLAKDQNDSVWIENTTLKPVYVEESGVTNYIKSIVSDTIRGKWFTVINEEKNQLRIILDKNESSKTRFLGITVWTSGNPQVTDKGHPHCDQFIIFQQPF